VPEGDTIHRHAAEIDAQLVGQTVKALYARGVAFPRLVGRTVDAVRAQGKHLLIDVGEARIHVHLGMSGRLRLADPCRVFTNTAARASLAIVTDRVAALWWRAPTVEVLRAAFAHAHPALQALGPDLLAGDFDATAMVTRARSRPDSTPLGALLLDQRVACGIGNVYKSEVLFLERLDPFAPIAAVDDLTLARIYTRARELMQHNLGPWRRTTTVDVSRGGFAPRGAARVHVYRRNGRPCRVCGTVIAAATQGEPPRRTYYCPGCQAPKTG
jgi:endonuclease VIII